jgi:hypothetical protein
MTRLNHARLNKSTVFGLSKVKKDRLGLWPDGQGVGVGRLLQYGRGPRLRRCWRGLGGGFGDCVLGQIPGGGTLGLTGHVGCSLWLALTTV